MGNIDSSMFARERFAVCKRRYVSNSGKISITAPRSAARRNQTMHDAAGCSVGSKLQNLVKAARSATNVTIQYADNGCANQRRWSSLASLASLGIQKFW